MVMEARFMQQSVASVVYDLLQKTILVHFKYLLEPSMVLCLDILETQLSEFFQSVVL